MNRIITLSRKLSLGSSMDDARKSGNEDDLSIIAERGQVACRDYPHSRHLCAQHPFNRTPHEAYCYKVTRGATVTYVRLKLLVNTERRLWKGTAMLQRLTASGKRREKPIDRVAMTGNTHLKFENIE